MKTVITLIVLSLASAVLAADEASMSATRAPEADAHTVLMLHFENPQDGIATDSSERKNNGKIAAGATVTGKFGTALQFDGDHDFVDCGGQRGGTTDFNFGTDTDFTIELWVKTGTVAPASHLINKKCNPDASEPGWMIYLQEGKPVAVIADGERRVVLQQDTAVNDGHWHHLALVAERKGNAVLYVDGVAGESASLKELGHVNNFGRSLRIGDRAHDGDFEGLIDEVRISTIARKFK
jgi:hypothetical protein